MPLGGARQTARQTVATHESFLRHRSFRWLKIAAALCLVALVGYVAADVKPRPNGGSWYGYTLGTIGAGLIAWLALLGIRKRTMTRGAWSLKAWTSAHVYLGLALLVIGTLHTGFQLGWNVHTLAWVLMVIVIVSGIYGVVVYAMLPTTLSNSREEMTRGQMAEALDAIDRQLEVAAQPLAHGADLILAALQENAASGWLRSRLSGNYRRSATQTALAALNRLPDQEGPDSVIRRVEALLQRRLAQLDQMRRYMRIKALLEVWLYVHVPATLALLAALTAHIVSVFYYW